MQESAWVQLRQAAHHWTTVVTLLNGDPVGVIPLGGTLQDAFNDARVLKNDGNRVGHLLEKGKPFLCHSRAYGGYTGFGSSGKDLCKDGIASRAAIYSILRSRSFQFAT